MPKQRVSMSFDNDTFTELIGLTIYRRDFSQSSKTNAAAAAIHAAYSKLPKEAKQAIDEQIKRNQPTALLDPVGQFNEMVAQFSEMYAWMQECKQMEVPQYAQNHC